MFLSTTHQQHIDRLKQLLVATPASNQARRALIEKAIEMAERLEVEMREIGVDIDLEDIPEVPSIRGPRGCCY